MPDAKSNNPLMVMEVGKGDSAVCGFYVAADRYAIGRGLNEERDIIESPYTLSQQTFVSRRGRRMSVLSYCVLSELQRPLETLRATSGWLVG